MKNPPGGMPSSGQLYTKVFIRQNISTIWGKGWVKGSLDGRAREYGSIAQSLD